MRKIEIVPVSPFAWNEYHVYRFEQALSPLQFGDDEL